MPDGKDYAPRGVGAPHGGENSERFGGGSPNFSNTNSRANGRTSSGATFAEKCARALADALLLTAQGYRCFPCQRNKRPATPHGFKEGTADPEQLRALWSKHPGELIGVSTGQASGVDVLDIDAKHGEARQWWAAHRDRMPSTRVHRTRSGGLHALFRHAPDLPCSVGRIALGIDIRADGGYAIWWPAAGLPVLQDAPLAAWPAWLPAQLLPRPRPVIARTAVPDDYALNPLIRLVASAREGERNRVAFWAACRAGEMVASGRLNCSGATAAAIIAEAAMRAGLSRAEAARTALSGIEAGGRTHG